MHLTSKLAFEGPGFLTVASGFPVSLVHFEGPRPYFDQFLRVQALFGSVLRVQALFRPVSMGPCPILVGFNGPGLMAQAPF